MGASVAAVITLAIDDEGEDGLRPIFVDMCGDHLFKCSDGVFPRIDGCGNGGDVATDDAGFKTGIRPMLRPAGRGWGNPVRVVGFLSARWLTFL